MKNFQEEKEKCTMTKEFIENVTSKVSTIMGNRYSVTVQPIPRNNDSILIGLIIKDELEKPIIAPTIYLDPYYQRFLKGSSVDVIAKDIVTTFYKNNNETFDVSSFTNFENVKNNICYKLVNTKKNLKLLNDVPHRKIQDLSILYYVNIGKIANGVGSILIHNVHLDFWNISEEDLYNLASNNTKRLLPVRIMSMVDTLKNVTPPDILDTLDNFMYIMTNSQNLYGATSILYNDVLDNFANSVNSNCWLLPSSIHEWIIIPDNGEISKTMLTGMITEVNATEVANEEILGTHPYYYDRTSKDLSY